MLGLSMLHRCVLLIFVGRRRLYRLNNTACVVPMFVHVGSPASGGFGRGCPCDNAAEALGALEMLE